MNSTYVEAVRLLLEAIPVLFKEPRFAIKGGTAINLFVRDLPRLSVDIDVVFTDHSAATWRSCPRYVGSCKISRD